MQENSTGKTFWDILFGLTRKLPAKFIFILILIFIVSLFGITTAGHLRFRYFDGKLNVEAGRKPSSSEIIDQNIAGKWKAVIYYQEFDEFKKRRKHELDFSISISSINYC